MGLHIFEILGGRIFWQVGSLGIKKFRTICGMEVRVKYVTVLHPVQQTSPLILGSG